jgi:hypothetical protein
MAAPPRTEAAIPAWIESDLSVVNGRDPLGLDAIATYRIMPELLPGILQLSRRARYFSFFAYLLSVFRSHVDQPTMHARPVHPARRVRVRVCSADLRALQRRRFVANWCPR